jgi:hypothetical protein
MDKIEYRVRPVTRYYVTKYEQSENGGGCSSCGEYDSESLAQQVAYALCKADHQRLGWPLDDPRIQYPAAIIPDEPIPKAG